GIPTPEPFKLLEANKSLTLRTLGLRKYCFIGDKQYYYLDVELIDNNEKTKAGSTKYKKIRDKSGRQV
ncbi:16946_t:CDS:1, partial [Racocetra persica]